MTRSALDILGRDFDFPHAIPGLPSKLSDFADLHVDWFTTTDGVKLADWSAGEGDPLIFLPGWGANGAMFVNILYLLRQRYRIHVLDPRNHGLSDRTPLGSRVARFSADVNAFIEHLDVPAAYLCGWSMGAATLWGYIDLFGSGRIRKAAFVDEPISIYSHADWSERERLDAGGMTSSPERMVDAFGGAPTNDLIVDMTTPKRYAMQDSPAFANSESFAATIVRNDPAAVSRVLFDHIMNDWRDVIRHKIDFPVAVFTGDLSASLESQRWAASVIPDAQLHVYTEAEHGDHFLMFKNPFKFTADLTAFLEMG